MVGHDCLRRVAVDPCQGRHVLQGDQPWRSPGPAGRRPRLLLLHAGFAFQQQQELRPHLCLHQQLDGDEQHRQGQVERDHLLAEQAAE